MNTVTRSSYPIGSSCPWRIVAPAWMTPIARTLEAARTRPNVRAMLAAETAKAMRPEPVETPASADPITFNGHEVDAPGFTQSQFDRAMVRAFIDDLEVTADSQLPDRWMVSHRNAGVGYHVTRERCGCKAGSARTPCKHRAFLIAHLDVRQPAIAKQWQKLYTDRSARVAA